MSTTHKWEIADRSQVGEARRSAVTLGQRLGLSEDSIGKLSLIITELGTNLVKHTQAGGKILANVLERNGISGVELLSLDKGPGIRNMNDALRDGYSTAGSPGTGLGAIKRLASSFDFFSIPDVGTVLLVRLWFGPVPEHPKGDPLDVGALRLPYPGEEICGDSWARTRVDQRDLLLVSDGLGHGLKANEASEEAVRTFLGSAHLSPTDMLATLHTALRSTRGAVAAVAEIDHARGSFQFAGVGNISGMLLAPGKTHGLISHNGTLGQDSHRIQAFSYPWTDDTIMIMHTDGLSQRWNLERYPGLERKPAILIAGVLYRDLDRGRDDVAVVVARSVRAA